MNPTPLDGLSLEALGLLCRLHGRGLTSFTLSDVQHLEAGGVGRDRAMRLLSELKVLGQVHRTRGGFTLAGSPSELFNNYVFSVKSDFQENTVFRLHTKRSTRDQDSVVAAQPEPTETTDFQEFSSDPVQAPLDGLSDEPPTKPKKPRRSRSDVPAEARALYPAMFDLTKSPRKGERAMGVYTKARDLWVEFQATPEQVAAFGDWFRMFSTAAQIAARERRPLNAPLPRHVYEQWPQFLVWWQVKQEADAREAEREAARREAEEQRPQKPEGVNWRELAEYYHPFRGKGTAPNAPAAPTVMTASGRRL